MSLYRKYRSQDFDELVGQEPVVRTLKNAIATGRIAHAYLFTGPRGVGKTSAARLLARAANCLSEGPDKPCNKCANCLAVAKDVVTDLIEIDAASNTGVDNIREIIERANFAPSVWHTKFYVIDEAHMLSVSAFNALLKTLEEPPPQTAFILATTEVHKVPATVASRCQRFDFRKIPLSAMTARLEYICGREGIEAEKAALELVARQATGSLRDALSLLDQLRVFAEGAITLKSVQDLLGASGAEQVCDFADMLVGGDLAGGLQQINHVIDEGLDPRQFNRQIVEHLRGLMLLKTGAAAGADSSLLDVTEELRSRMEAQAGKANLGELLHWVRSFAEADAGLRSSAYSQLPLEMALVTAMLKQEGGSARPTSREQPGEQSPSHEHAPNMPRQRPQPQTPPQPELRSAPPPIHSELGSPNGNGKQPVSPPQPPANGDNIRQAVPGQAGGSEPPLEPVSVGGGSGDAPDGDGLAGEPEYLEDAVAGGGDGLDKLRNLWPRLVDQINARSKQMASAFRNPDLVRPYSVQGTRVTISFRDPFQARKSQGDPQRGLIEDSLSRVLGHKCVLESILFTEEGKAGEDAGPFPGELEPRNTVKERKPSPYETTRGKAAMNIFNITKFDE